MTSPKLIKRGSEPTRATTKPAKQPVQVVKAWIAEREIRTTQAARVQFAALFR